MNRKPAVLIATFGILAFSGCTAQQRHLAQQAMADEATTETTYVVDIGEPLFPVRPAESNATITEAGAVTTTVDCGQFTVRANGYPEGTVVTMGVTDQEPFQFTTHPGGDAGTVSITTGRSFTATVDVDGERVFSQAVDCPTSES